MYNLTARRNNHSVHVLGETFYVINGNLIFFGRTRNTPMLDKTSDMLARNSDIHYRDINSCLIASFAYSFLYRIYCFIDIENYSFHNTL